MTRRELIEHMADLLEAHPGNCRDTHHALRRCSARREETTLVITAPSWAVPVLVNDTFFLATSVEIITGVAYKIQIGRECV